MHHEEGPEEAPYVSPPSLRPLAWGVPAVHSLPCWAGWPGVTQTQGHCVHTMGSFSLGLRPNGEIDRQTEKEKACELMAAWEPASLGSPSPEPPFVQWACEDGTCQGLEKGLSARYPGGAGASRLDSGDTQGDHKPGREPRVPPDPERAELRAAVAGRCIRGSLSPRRSCLSRDCWGELWPTDGSWTPEGGNIRGVTHLLSRSQSGWRMENRRAGLSLPCASGRSRL